MREGGAFSYQHPRPEEHGRFFVPPYKNQHNLPEIELLPTDQESEQYLDQHELDTHEARMKHEYSLAKKLGESVLFKQPEQTESLRRTIWMLSNHLYETSKVPLKNTIEALQKKIRSLMEIPVEYMGEESHDIQERIDQHDREIQSWFVILGALRRQLTGDELTHALKGQDETSDAQDTSIDPLAEFEFEYSKKLRDATGHYHDKTRKTAAKEISELRMIRDRIYYNLLFPNLAKMEYRITSNKKAANG
jgi:hypothetical protein